MRLGAERKKWVSECNCGFRRLQPLAAPPRPAHSGLGPPLPQRRARPAPSAGRLGGAQQAPPPPSAGAGGVAGEGRDVWGAGVPMTASERAAPGRRARLQVPGLRSHPGRWVWVRSGWRARRGRTGEAPGQPPSRAPGLARRLLTGRAWPEGAACEGPRLPSLLQTFREGLFPVADRAGGVVSTPLRLGGVDCGDGETRGYTKFQSPPGVWSAARRCCLCVPRSRHLTWTRLHM